MLNVLSSDRSACLIRLGFEDAEGRSESAQMFEEGVSEAEHDQMRQAPRAEETSDETES
jgi:hypothetical protein